jgi:hypothetical protein
MPPKQVLSSPAHLFALFFFFCYYDLGCLLGFDSEVLKGIHQTKGLQRDALGKFLG